MNGHGGKRRRHVPPALTAAQAEALRAERRACASHKLLAYNFHVSRNTVWKVLSYHAPYGTLQGGAS